MRIIIFIFFNKTNFTKFDTKYKNICYTVYSIQKIGGNMKRKFITFILSICFILPCAFLFSACSNEPPKPSLEGVETNVIDTSLLEYYNETTKTFTIPYNTFFAFGDYSFSLTEKYSNNTTKSVNTEDCSISIPSELQTDSTIPVGNYVITITYNEYSFTYYINVVNQEIVKPTLLTEETYTYENEYHTHYVNPTWFDSDKMVISGNEQVNAGTHQVTVSLKPGYAWNDGTSEAIIFDWVINKKTINRPTYINNQQYRYDSSIKFPQFNDYSSTVYEFVCNNETEIGNYIAKIKLSDKDNCQWDNGSSEDLSLNWSIIIGQLQKPTLVNNTVTVDYYDNFTVAQQDILYENVNNYNSYDNKINVSGNTGINVGNYNVTFTISNKSKYEWADGTNSDISYDWHIAKAKLSDDLLPQIQTTEFEYSGEVITPNINYENALFNVFGDINATNVKVGGNYQITFALKPVIKQNFEFTYGGTNDIVKEWTIYPQALAVPNLGQPTSKEYNGEEQEFNPIIYNSNLFEFKDNKQTVSGNYEGKIYLKDKVNYKWVDGNLSQTDYVSFSYSITPKKVNKPSLASGTNLTYTGAEQSIDSLIEHFNSNLMDITNNKITNVVTNQESTIALKDTHNYCWNDETINEIKIIWSMKPMEIDVSIIDSNNYYYNEQEQTVEFAGLDHFVGNFSSDLSISGNTTQIEPKMYTIELTLNSENYVWKNISGATKYLNWTIQKRLRAKPTSDLTYNDNKFVYSGNEYKYSPEGFDVSYMTISNNAKIDAGEYVASVVLSDTVHDQWDDKTSDAVTFNWLIRSYVVEKPTAIAVDYTYEGMGINKSYVPAGYDERYMTILGNVQYLAGKYVCTVKLKNPGTLIRNYVWADNTPNDLTDNSTSDLTFNWEIKKQVVNLNFSQTWWSGVEDDYFRESNIGYYSYAFLENGKFDTSKIKVTNSYSINDSHYSDELLPGKINRAGTYKVYAKFEVIDGDNYILNSGLEDDTAVYTWSLYDTELEFNNEYWEGDAIYYYGTEFNLPIYNLINCLETNEVNKNKIYNVDHFNLTYIYYNTETSEQLEEVPTEVGSYEVRVNHGNTNVTQGDLSFKFRIVNEEDVVSLAEGYADCIDLSVAGEYNFILTDLEVGSTYQLMLQNMSIENCIIYIDNIDVTEDVSEELTLDLCANETSYELKIEIFEDIDSASLLIEIM